MLFLCVHWPKQHTIATTAPATTQHRIKYVEKNEYSVKFNTSGKNNNLSGKKFMSIYHGNASSKHLITNILCAVCMHIYSYRVELMEYICTQFVYYFICVIIK